MKIEPGIKYEFSEPFRSQLIRALNGYCPEKPEGSIYVQKAMAKKAPSVSQLKYLLKLGVVIVPSTMKEASILIQEVLDKR